MIASSLSCKKLKPEICLIFSKSIKTTTMKSWFKKWLFECLRIWMNSIQRGSFIETSNQKIFFLKTIQQEVLSFLEILVLPCKKINANGPKLGECVRVPWDLLHPRSFMKISMMKNVIFSVLGAFFISFIKANLFLKIEAMTKSKRWPLMIGSSKEKSILWII